MNLILFLSLFAIYSQKVVAEYRAYELELRSSSGETRLIRSTFDQIQYRGYHMIPKGAQLSYVRSWMCKGSTHGFKPICTPPQVLTTEEPTDNLQGPAGSAQGT